MTKFITLCATAASLGIACLSVPRASAQAPLENPPARVYELPKARGAALSDEEIVERVRMALKADSLVSAATIAVDCGAGIVTLSGRQPLLIAKERAAQIAEAEPGVHRVVNEIEVRPLRSAEATLLVRDIEFALRADPALEAAEIRVEANASGAIVLVGTVQSGAERFLAEQLAKSVSGVSSVHNRIQVRRAAPRPDEEIAADVRRVLQWDPDAGAPEPEVRVENAVVTLVGTVRNGAEKRRAAGLSWVAGVKHVDITKLKTRSAEMTERSLPGTPLELQSDHAIARVVREAVRSDPRLDGSHIEVHVENRVVTLSGYVANKREKEIARNIPYGLLGVASVQDDIRVEESSANQDN